LFKRIDGTRFQAKEKPLPKQGLSLSVMLGHATES
jgi:hypothetical protein